MKDLSPEVFRAYFAIPLPFANFTPFDKAYTYFGFGFNDSLKNNISVYIKPSLRVRDKKS